MSACVCVCVRVHSQPVGQTQAPLADLSVRCAERRGSGQERVGEKRVFSSFVQDVDFQIVGCRGSFVSSEEQSSDGRKHSHHPSTQARTRTHAHPSHAHTSPCSVCSASGTPHSMPVSPQRPCCAEGLGHSMGCTSSPPVPAGARGISPAVAPGAGAQGVSPAVACLRALGVSGNAPLGRCAPLSTAGGWGAASAPPIFPGLPRPRDVSTHRPRPCPLWWARLFEKGPPPGTKKVRGPHSGPRLLLM